MSLNEAIQAATEFWKTAVQRSSSLKDAETLAALVDASIGMMSHVHEHCVGGNVDRALLQVLSEISMLQLSNACALCAGAGTMQQLKDELESARAQLSEIAEREAKVRSQAKEAVERLRYLLQFATESIAAPKARVSELENALAGCGSETTHQLKAAAATHASALEREVVQPFLKFDRYYSTSLAPQFPDELLAAARPSSSPATKVTAKMQRHAYFSRRFRTRCSHTQKTCPIASPCLLVSCGRVSSG
jgi:LPS O-antigen subunit length determinant protein (WzzB/FepE family)